MACDGVGRRRRKILSATKQQPSFHPEKAALLLGETEGEDKGWTDEVVKNVPVHTDGSGRKCVSGASNSEEEKWEERG